jgi:hypothetical protein
MIFAIFSRIFTENWKSAQKRDSRAILLKTVLVHVSYIQNTQIRGETIVKVFGKVDTFWTYQLSYFVAGIFTNLQVLWEFVNVVSYALLI